MSYTHYFTSKIYADRLFDVPGVGRIHGYSVGSCSHTMGFDMVFMAEGAEAPVRGGVRFSTYVAEDGSLQWRMVHVTGPGSHSRDWRLPPFTEDDQPYFPAAAMAGMRAMVETMGERDETNWYSQAIGAIDMELNELLRSRADLVHTDTHLTGLLAKPAEPKTHFVPKSKDPAGKGFTRATTEDERAEHRAMWEERIARSRIRLTAFDAANGARIALLTRLRESMNGRWKRKDSRTVMELYASAIAEPVVDDASVVSAARA